MVRSAFTGESVQDSPLFPIRTGSRQPARQKASVFARLKRCDRNRSVRRQFVRVDENSGMLSEAIGTAQDPLILLSIVCRKKVPASAFDRHRTFLVIPKL